MVLRPVDGDRRSVQILGRMRDSVLALEAAGHRANARGGARTRGSTGPAVTVALCGDWKHQGPCRWPHHTSVGSDEAGALVVRTVVVSEVAEEPTHPTHVEPLRLSSRLARSPADGVGRWTIVREGHELPTTGNRPSGPAGSTTDANADPGQAWRTLRTPCGPPSPAPSSPPSFRPEHRARRSARWHRCGRRADDRQPVAARLRTRRGDRLGRLGRPRLAIPDRGPRTTSSGAHRAARRRRSGHRAPRPRGHTSR